MPIDSHSLPKDPEILQQMLVDLTTQLDKTQRLLRQLMEAKSGTRSEQLSADQLRLFGQELVVPEAAAEYPSHEHQRGAAARADKGIRMRLRASRSPAVWQQLVELLQGGLSDAREHIVEPGKRVHFR